MRPTRHGEQGATGWKPVPDPPDRFSSGIPDFDRLLAGGYKRGSVALFETDETVGLEDLDLLLFPTYLNALYQSRGMVGVLPSRDTPHDFRARLTRFLTRRRFDSRVRLFDYVGEDQGLSYVVTIGDPDDDPLHPRRDPKVKKQALAKAVAAERAAQGGRGRPFVELVAFEVFDTLMGTENALKVLYRGIKRTRNLGNLGIGILGPGLGCAAGIRRMVDTQFVLHRDEVGLLIRGVRPLLRSHVIIPDPSTGPPHAAFVPRPARPESVP
ncbi:MAG TPA: gas vesicle protein GvpD basic region 2 domain-containing protein [Thermoplasmata archaeon]|jgi:hypothetical protein|nr:gas vesicle protein GvpD basic region 2 domain-containing protein [Thermoplasmata archaeon]